MRVHIDIGHYDDGGNWQSYEKFPWEAPDIKAAKQDAVTRASTTPLWTGADQVRVHVEGEEPYEASFPDLKNPIWNR